MPTDERVLVIPMESFYPIGWGMQFLPIYDTPFEGWFSPNDFKFRPRSEVETDPSFLQLIPYIILACGDQWFHYRRGPAGTEKRLQGLRSVGVGGHISEADAAGGSDPYRTGMMREVTEEVEIGCGWTERFLGFIHDDRTPVGEVHLGVVHLFELESPSARSREDALADAGFAPRAELRAARDEFETWSQFVLDR